MLYLIAFLIFAALAVCAALSIFMAKEMTHAMVGFLLVAVSGAAFVAIMGLPLLALLQLFIMVGGVSTYLFVGVSSDNLSRFRHTSLPVLALLIVVLAAVPIYKTLQGYGTTAVNTLTPAALTSAIGANIGLFYIVAIMLFGIGIASIMMIKASSKGGSR